MSVHTVNNHQTSISLQSNVAKSGAKAAQASSFAEVFGTYSPRVSTAAGSTPTTTTTATNTQSPAQTGFAALFSNYTPAATTTQTAADTPAPFTATYEQSAYVTDPNGVETSLNPMELATASTAAEVAQLVGGTVVNESMGGNFTSSVPTREIAVPGSNTQINAGLAANLFATYGTAQGSQAWVTIDQDLGLS